MNPREKRLSDNEILYREVNERVRELQEGFDVADEQVEFVCECANLDCSQRVTLTVGEYERIREHGIWFAIRPGHEVADIEQVVEQHDGYVVIEKLGDGAERAAAEDPRG